MKKKNAEEDKLEEEAELADIEEQKKKKEEKLIKENIYFSFNCGSCRSGTYRGKVLY